jgi:hypothetical protein
MPAWALDGLRRKVIGGHLVPQLCQPAGLCPNSTRGIKHVVYSIVPQLTNDSAPMTGLPVNALFLIWGDQMMVGS